MNVQTVKRLLGSSSPLFAMGDQLAMVGGTFLLGIVVARTSSLEQFANYSVLYAWLVLLNALHGPLLNEPLVLHAAGQKHAVPSLRAATWGLFMPPIIVVAVVQWYVGTVQPGQLIAVSAAGAGSLCYWSLKSELHCAQRHRAAFVLSASASLLAVGLALVLIRLDLPPVEAALAALAAASAGCTLVASGLDRRPRGQRLPVVAIGRHAGPGIIAACLVWLAGNGTLLWLASHGRLSDAAGLRGVMTLLLPINQMMVGLSSFLLPLLARRNGEQGGHGPASSILPVLLGCIGAAMLFAIVLWPLSGWLLERAYGAAWRGYSAWLQMGALILPVSWVVVTVLRTRLRAHGANIQLIGVYTLALSLGFPASLLVLRSSHATGPMLSFCLLQAILAVGMTATLFSSKGLPMAADTFSFRSDQMRKALKLPWLVLLALAARLSRRDPGLWVIGRRTGVGDGPLAIVHAVRGQGLPVRIVWLASSVEEEQQVTALGLESARRGSLAAIRTCLRAGVGIMTHGFSDLSGPAIWGATTVQLWHGAPLKRIGLDRATHGNTSLLQRVSQVFERYWNAHYTHVIAGSADAAVRLGSALGVDHARVHATGDPRMDLILPNAGQARQQVEALARQHGLSGQCFVLVAPTWRDGGDAAVRPGQEARAMIGARNDCVVFVRAHPFAADIESLAEMPNVVALDPVRFPDITALLGAFDVLVTDYSSIAMDFAPLQRPILLVAPDLDAYVRSPGLYESYVEFSSGTGMTEWDEAFAVLAQVCDADEAVCTALTAAARRLSERFHPNGLSGNAARVVAIALQQERRR